MMIPTKPPARRVSVTDHMGPTEHPTGMAGWRRAAPTASPSRSNGAGSPDPGANPGTTRESCPRLGRAGSTDGQRRRCFRQRPGGTAAVTRARRSASASGAPSTLLSDPCTRPPATCPDR